MNFQDSFQENPFILFDGAMGTQLYSKGISKGHCYDELNISMPEAVLDIHREFLEAGAAILTTNTFGANRSVLADYYGLAGKTKEINYYGARLAKRIAKDHAFVAGSIGPITRPLDKEKKLSPSDIREIIYEQLEGLMEGGIDLLLFETFASLSELLIGVETAREFEPDLFIIASMTYPSNGLTLFGKTPYEVSLKLDGTSAQVIGANCGTGPQSILEAVKKMGSVTEKELIAMPNAGLAQFSQGKFYYPSNPNYFARYGKKYLENGIKVLGGCCGTTPEHIRRLHTALEGLSPRARRVKAISIQERSDVRKDPVITSPLRKLLQSGSAIALEVDPPKDPDFDKFFKSIEPYTSQLDIINVSDSPMAKPRMSPIAAGKLLKDRLHLEIIVHYTARDRNILGIQSDLLGASALGLENFLLLGGDPPSIGDYPFATGVYDLTSEGLVEMLNSLNHGIDILGNPLGKQTGFFIGVGTGMGEKGNIDLDSVLRKLKKGAHFIITQPVFDIPGCRKTLENFKSSGIPVLVSIMPLISGRNAEYIHFEVPGISVPAEFLQRMEGKRGREGEKEGAAISRRIVRELSPYADGILFMPPLGRYRLLEDILS